MPSPTITSTLTKPFTHPQPAATCLPRAPKGPEASESRALCSHPFLSSPAYIFPGEGAGAALCVSPIRATTAKETFQPGPCAHRSSNPAFPAMANPELSSSLIPQSLWVWESPGAVAKTLTSMCPPSAQHRDFGEEKPQGRNLCYFALDGSIHVKNIPEEGAQTLGCAIHELMLNPLSSCRGSENRHILQEIAVLSFPDLQAPR